MKWLDDKIDKRSERLFIFLSLAAYVVVQSFAVHAPLFPADDLQELSFVNGMSSWTELLGRDFFGLFRPVKNVIFHVLSCFDLGNISTFRLICIGIGIFSFFPVWGLCRRVLGANWSAALAAAIWLVSPTLVSSTAWLSCVNIQLMAGLFAWALCLHDDGRVCGAAICLVGACLSYESAVAIGPVLVAFDYFLRPERWRTARARWSYVVYAVVTGAYLLSRWYAGSAASLNGSLAGVSRVELIGAAAYFSLQHVGIWFWPFGNMAVFGGYSAGQVPVLGHIVCWVVVIVLVAAALVLRRRAPVFAFGVALAVLAFLPTSNILGFGNGPYGDYYMDVASIGLSIALVSAVRGLTGVSGRFARPACVLAAALLLARACGVVESARWAYLWADGERAFQATITTFPKAYYGFVVCAQRLCDRNDFAGALAHCDEAERLIGADEERMRTVHMVRAICALRGEQNAEKALAWLAKCERGCSRASIIRACHFYRGCVAEDLQNDLSVARREYEAALPLKIGSEDIRTADRLARILAVTGDTSRAIALWKNALRVSPGDMSVMWNLSVALHEVGDHEEAARLQARAKGAMNAAR